MRLAMARANALVDAIGERPREVIRFAGGRTGRLDPSLSRSAIWLDVLTSLHETGQPAYVEIDPETGYIIELLLPLRFTVGDIERLDDGTLQVELVVSHARHFLRPSNPHFDEMRRVLESAREEGTAVLVTESLDASEMIDVRPAEPVRR